MGPILSPLANSWIIPRVLPKKNPQFTLITAYRNSGAFRNKQSKPCLPIDCYIMLARFWSATYLRRSSRNSLPLGKWSHALGLSWKYVIYQNRKSIWWSSLLVKCLHRRSSVYWNRNVVEDVADRILHPRYFQMPYLWINSPSLVDRFRHKGSYPPWMEQINIWKVSLKRQQRGCPSSERWIIYDFVMLIFECPN